ncbi:Na/Pi cotransporter family protein [Sporosalibacterium faouarense]|uniref:Na/Pi cotransporter family protein n=1 Tax=Sporosalibacterium faouarense TaxID=516123 RepID=UPI00141D592A|nr:Na/Pi cotransporter family protein [Sporosalibacterium faouarense]MTI46980.1 Na/Pi cotransporter family protein [Bacillota bacterium]
MEIAFGVLGGLGLFLYGMNLMGAGLQKVAGDRLKSLIGILTKNRVMGVFVGAIVTMLVQSSSATTVMVVGFVNAGIMNLTQAIGVIMGANIGTTITAQLIAFKLTDIAPMVIAIGVAIWLFTSKKRHKEIAEVLIGFGILFLGMSLMSDQLKPLSDSQMFENLITSLDNPLLGILVGFVITVAVQSSSASMGLLLAVTASGLINLDIAFPILFGQNIGTCVTALLSSIGANKTAKRAAVMHLLFNLIGTTIFMILIYLTPMKSLIIQLSPGKIERQIANAHTIFNIFNVLIQLPFAGFIVLAVKKLVPGEVEETTGLKYLDDRIMETPSIAVGQASKEVLRMGRLVQENLKTSIEGFMKKDEKLTHRVFAEEKVINELEKDITQYLIKLSKESLSDEESITVSTLFHTINDLERIGDHADNIAELAQYRIDNKLYFTDQALEELQLMFDKVRESFKESLWAFKTANAETAKRVIAYEKDIDLLEKQYRANHIKRLNESQCHPSSGIVFLDTISNLERVADHSSNIAISIIEAVE